MGLGKTYSTRYLADSNNNTGASDQVLSSTPTGISWVDANTLSTGFWLADGNDIYNSNSGFVGIGTTDPQNDLDVVSADPTLLLRFDGTVNGANSGRIKFSEGGTNHVGHMEIHYDGAANKMYFNSPIDGNTGLMTIERTGDVGINTTNPTSKLHIAKTTTWGEMSNPIINIQNNGTGGNINTAHNMGSITWLSGTVSTAEIKAIRNTPASGDNVELRFSTSAAGVQGERMTINNNGIVFINNSLGVNVTSITTGYKLVVGGGDIRASQAVAKISLGQLGSQGDSFFGASGIGSPTVGSQDYGFYSAHNAYRTSTGAWKHSRADAIGAVRLLGSGGGSSGNSGFSFDYSANNGSNDITWTNRMRLFNTGILKLSAYGAGILQTSSDGTVSSGGDIDIDESVIINDNLVNYRFTALENTSTQYWLLCYNGGSNDVNGTLWGDRSSGHHQAMNLDIVVSAKSASMQTGMLTTKQVLEANEQYTLVTLTYDSNNYIAIKYNGHPYPITGNGYFSGLLKSTIGSNFLTAVNASQVSAVAAFSNANTKATIQANKVGIGTADPDGKLHVEDTILHSGTPPPILTLEQQYPEIIIKDRSGSEGYVSIDTYYKDSSDITVANYSINNNPGYVGIRTTFDSGTTGGTLFVQGQNEFSWSINNTSEVMRIDSSGKVGIGTTSNTTIPLHVNQGSVSGTVIKASGIQAQIEIQTSTAGDAHLYMRPNSTGNNAAIFKMTAGTNYNWRWQDDATTPVVFMQLSQSNSSLSVKGDVIAYGSPSDERYKENIKPIESALDKVTKLQGVTFDWKESDNLLDIKEDIGFIAQDVQKVVPELVRENEDGKLSLRYQGITPILLEAIKELKAEIEELKKQIK